MRVKRRLAVCFGLTVLLMGERQSVFAQGQPGTYQMSQGGPPGNSYYAPAPGPNFNGPTAPPANYNSSLANPEYPGYPSSIPVVPPPMPGADTYGGAINPYPQISPYDYSYQNDSNVGGIWEHTERTRDRKYYFNSDFLFMSTKPQQGIFGNPGAQTYVRQIRDFIDSSSTGGGTGGGSGGTTGGNATTTLLQNQGFVTNTADQFASEANYYNALDMGTLGNIVTVGARFSGGWWNPDNSGFSGTFWFGGKGTDDFNAADDLTQKPHDMKGLEQIIRFIQNNNGLPATFAVDDLARFDPALNTNKLSPSQILEQNLLNLRGLPVGDNTARGQTIPYDIYFDVKSTSQQIGGSLDYYFNPVFERKWLSVAPAVGVTYLNIHETLSFLGIDSGVLYSSGASGSTTGTTAPNRDFKAQSFPNGIDDNQDGIIDNSGTPEASPASSSSGGGTTTGGTALYTAATPFALLPATIDINTSTNLIGPTGGLRYVIGGKNLHIIGETKFGLMANFEQIGLSGNNIGSTTRIDGKLVNYPTELTPSAIANPSPETGQDLIVPTPQNPNPNAFSSSQTHAHVSPLFQQSIIAEAPVLQYVPVVNKIWPLNNAIFRLGYTFIWAGGVIETNQSISYQGDPMADLFPRITPSHTGWWTQNCNLGVSWEW